MIADEPTTAGGQVAGMMALAGIELSAGQRRQLDVGLRLGRDGKWGSAEATAEGAREDVELVLAARALAGLLLFGERRVLYSTRSHGMAQDVHRRIADLLSCSPALGPLVKRITRTNGEEGIELITGARMRFTGRPGTGIRGYSAACVIFDEASGLDRRHVGEVIPVLVNQPNPQMWFGYPG